MSLCNSNRFTFARELSHVLLQSDGGHILICVEVCETIVKERDGDKRRLLRSVKTGYEILDVDSNTDIFIIILPDTDTDMKFPIVSEHFGTDITCFRDFKSMYNSNCYNN